MRLVNGTTCSLAEGSPNAGVAGLDVPPDNKDKTVLIVDDDQDTLRLLEVLLASDGYGVRTAENADQAIKLLFAFTPAAVLVDIRMPGMDGLQLTRLLKLTGKGQKVPILAVSAANSAEAISAAYDAGCDGYITKPVELDTFASTVRKYLEYD